MILSSCTYIIFNILYTVYFIYILTIFHIFKNKKHHYLIITEIYRIVSQKQIRDPPEGDTIRPQNVEPIDVKPTMNSEGMRKQCCQ